MITTCALFCLFFEQQRLNRIKKVNNSSNQALAGLSSCRDPSASSALYLSICTFESLKMQVLSQSALDADGSRQEDNSRLPINPTSEHFRQEFRTIPFSVHK